jgi:hypothetical protein
VDDNKAVDASAALSINKNNTSISRGYKERNKPICEYVIIVVMWDTP